MPMALATGSGENTNRSTLATQQLFLTFGLNSLVTRTVASIKKFIFKRISDYNGFSEVPEIVWGTIAIEEMNDKAKRLNEYVKSGILTPDEIKKYVNKSEKL